MPPTGLADYQENYYSQYFAVSSGNYMIPSGDHLLALYDHDNDLRYEQFFGKHTLWNIWVGGFGDDILYRKFYYIYEDQVQSGPTVPEMLLTAAEALARQNQVSEAMGFVSQLAPRKARMRAGEQGIELEAGSQEEAIRLILDERHREMPFVMRWFDIRRSGLQRDGSRRRHRGTCVPSGG